ncbi:TadE/TadG family type IV pilus assembly protein [Castellaniella sp.]|uniref:TadE/TadG family type IV pilus assembly protein n=1 Tax=Castellaniella sp. TaxID=1955812 RepID=UPI002AFDE4AF|nr:TadE/TadG family type IV pilus assembly protein [Castellaniella sp.]
MAALLHRAFERFSRINCTDSGSATVQFILVLPLFMAIIGTVAYFTDAVMIRNKAAAATDAVSTAASMDTSITNAEAAAILAAGRAILQPIDANSTLVLSAVESSGGSFKVKWSDTLGGTALKPGAAFAFPSGAASSFGSETNKTVLVATVTVNVTSGLVGFLSKMPLASLVLPANLTFTQTSFALPLGMDANRWTQRVP